MKRIATGLFIGGFILMSSSLSFAESRVGERQERQQQRIGNGVRNGSLTAHETGHIEHQEARLNRQVRDDRRANGGHLTNNEKRQINHEQNGLSHEIYRDKHNGAKR